MFKVNKRSNIYYSGVFIVNFEYIWLVSNVSNVSNVSCFPVFENVNVGWNTSLP